MGVSPGRQPALPADRLCGPVCGGVVGWWVLSQLCHTMGVCGWKGEAAAGILLCANLDSLTNPAGCCPRRYQLHWPDRYAPMFGKRKYCPVRVQGRAGLQDLHRDDLCSCWLEERLRSQDMVPKARAEQRAPEEPLNHVSASPSPSPIHPLAPAPAPALTHANTTSQENEYPTPPASFEESVSAIGELIKEGKIKYWGLSNETTYGKCLPQPSNPECLAWCRPLMFSLIACCERSPKAKGEAKGQLTQGAHAPGSGGPEVVG